VVTVEIPLTRGLTALIDEADARAVMSAGCWYAHETRGLYYAVRTDRSSGRQRTLRMHNFLTGWPLVDHRDGNTLDNRRANLRPATLAQNAQNSAPWRGREFKGIRRRDNGLWQARITRDGCLLSLGTFPTPEDAALAYDRAANELFGDFARLNFPREDHHS